MVFVTETFTKPDPSIVNNPWESPCFCHFRAEITVAHRHIWLFVGIQGLHYACQVLSPQSQVPVLSVQPLGFSSGSLSYRNMHPRKVSKWGGAEAGESPEHCTYWRGECDMNISKAQVRETLWDFDQEQWKSGPQRNGRDSPFGVW